MASATTAAMVDLQCAKAIGDLLAAKLPANQKVDKMVATFHKFGLAYTAVVTPSEIWWLAKLLWYHINYMFVHINYLSMYVILLPLWQCYIKAYFSQAICMAMHHFFPWPLWQFINHTTWPKWQYINGTMLLPLWHSMEIYITMAATLLPATGTSFQSDPHCLFAAMPVYSKPAAKVTMKATRTKTLGKPCTSWIFLRKLGSIPNCTNCGCPWQNYPGGCMWHQDLAKKPKATNATKAKQTKKAKDQTKKAKGATKPKPPKMAMK